MTPMKTNIPILTASILLACVAPLLAANSSLIQSPLTNIGADADAAGNVLSTLTAQQSVLVVQVAKLAPSAAYEIEVYRNR